MLRPPDFPTETEQRELDNLVELQIDTAIEEKHIHEVTDKELREEEELEDEIISSDYVS